MEEFVKGKFARDRMERCGLTEDQINYIIHHQEYTYTSKGDPVFVATLPDGRKAKVKVRGNTLIDVFIFKASPNGDK